MKEFKVLKNYDYAVDYRLLINNELVKAVSKETLQELIETWLNKIQLNGKVEVSDTKSIMLAIAKYYTKVYKDKENHIIDLYKVKKQYDIVEV